MGRTKKKTVDYFPHFVTGSHRSVSILENRWGNDGYAFWFKLLELLCITEGHALDISTMANQEYLYTYTKVDSEKAYDIIQLLIELGNIDRELYEKHKILWCQSLVDNLKSVYDKRKVATPVKPAFDDVKKENHEEKQEKDEEPIKKKKYAEFVSMTEDEYKKLLSKYGQVLTQKAITVLDNYKGSNGKRYKSDYRAILNWVIAKVMEDEKRNGRNDINSRNVPSEFKPSSGFKQ